MTTYFPWRAFFRFFIVLFLVFSLWFIAFFQFLTPAQDTTYLAYGFLGIFVLSMGVSWYLSRPIHKLLEITRALVIKKENPSENVPEDVFEEEIGEYSELERLIKKLARKLRKKREQLQREREENQTFMASVQEGLISVSKTEDILFFNSNFATSFMDPQIINKDGLKLTDVLRNPHFYNAFSEVNRTGIPQRMTLQLNTRMEQQARFYSVSFAPLRNRDNEVYGVMSVFHDITDIKKTEQMRVDFVGNASHELRTPLTSIKGYLATLNDDYIHERREDIPRFLEIITRNVDRLIDLVSDLLTISTLESQPDLQLELIDPRKISEAVIHDLSIVAQEKRIAIHREGTVAPFVGDYGKIEQVLKNLVSNAIKYIPENRQIFIRWEDQNDKVVLRVIDNGPGIAEEHLSRLFERFYRVDKGRARDHGGTGLGLAIVKHIIQNHGGDIAVKSQIGIGAEFVCTIPRRHRIDTLPNRSV